MILLLENISLIGALEVLLYMESQPQLSRDKFEVISGSLPASPCDILSYDDKAVSDKAIKVAPNAKKHIQIGGVGGFDCNLAMVPTKNLQKNELLTQ